MPSELLVKLYLGRRRFGLLRRAFRYWNSPLWRPERLEKYNRQGWQPAPPYRTDAGIAAELDRRRSSDLECSFWGERPRHGFVFGRGFTNCESGFKQDFGGTKLWVLNSKENIFYSLPAHFID